MLGSQRRARVGGRRVGVDVQKPLGVPMTECSLELVTTRCKEQLKVCCMVPSRGAWRSFNS